MVREKYIIFSSFLLIYFMPLKIKKSLYHKDFVKDGHKIFMGIKGGLTRENGSLTTFFHSVRRIE